MGITKLHQMAAHAGLSLDDIVYVSEDAGAGDGYVALSTLRDLLNAAQLSSTIVTDYSVTTTGAYSALEADNGKVKEIDAGLTIPTGLSNGWTATFMLDNAAAQTLTTTGLTIKNPVAPGTSIRGGGIITVTRTNTANEIWIHGETE